MPVLKLKENLLFLTDIASKSICVFFQDFNRDICRLSSFSCARFLNLFHNILNTHSTEIILFTKEVILWWWSPSHLLPSQLPPEFISWTSTKTKMPNCIIFCSTNHSEDNHGSISATNNTSFQFSLFRGLMSSFHVIFHVICFFSTNEDIRENNWLQKFGNFLEKLLWWSFFQ